MPRKKVSKKTIPKNIEYAGFWIRFVAAIIDGIFSAIIFGIGFLVNTYLVGKYGYSVGKKILGMKIIKEGGTQPDLVDAIVREIVGKFISAAVLMLGFLLVGFDAKKQGLHDKIAKTYVVKA